MDKETTSVCYVIQSSKERGLALQKQKQMMELLNFTTIVVADKKLLFPRYYSKNPFRETAPPFHQFLASSSSSSPSTATCRYRNRDFVLSEKLLLRDEDYSTDMFSTSASTMSSSEEEEYDDESSSSSSVLSLSEKPDRNMALLDDYEIEEFDNFSSDPNHRSGNLSSSYNNNSHFIRFCVLAI